MKGGLILAVAMLAIPAAAQTPPAPSTVAAPIDPARLASAEKAVASLVPDGIYMTMMRDKFPEMMDAMMGQMSGMSAEDMPGMPSGDAKGKTFGELARAEDPAFDERMKITMRVMSEEMGRVFTLIEPQLRTGLARAFARKFTTAQLDDMNVFFATPSGKAFSSQYLLTFMDPEVMQQMMTAMPEMLKAMPAIIDKTAKATAHLPPPPKRETHAEKVPIND